MKNLEEWCTENNEQTLLQLYQNGGNKYKSDEIGFSSPRVVISNVKNVECRGNKH